MIVNVYPLHMELYILLRAALDLLVHLLHHGLNINDALLGEAVQKQQTQKKKFSKMKMCRNENGIQV